MNAQTMFVVGLGVALLWLRKRAAGGTKAADSTAARMDASAPINGSDSEMTLWDAYHGNNVVLKDYSHTLGGDVQPEPGSVGRAVVANTVNIAWNGDLR